MLKRRQAIVIFVFVLLALLPFVALGKKSSKSTSSSSSRITRKPSYRVTYGRTSPPRTSPPRTYRTTTYRPRHSPSKRLPITTLPSNFYQPKSTKRTTVYRTTTPRYINTTPPKISHGTGTLGKNPSFGWQDHTKKNHSNVSNSNKIGWQVPTPKPSTPPVKNNTSNIGWQVPKPKPSTVPVRNNTSNIGWQIPPPKNHSTIGTWTTRKPNVTSGGWQIPPPNSGGNYGWTTPRINASNVGWQIPTSKNHSNVPNSNLNGWPIPSNNNSKSTYPNSPPNKNIGWAPPPIHTTLPPKMNNQWTTKTNVTNIGNSPKNDWRKPVPNYNTSKPGFPLSPNQNTGWIRPKNSSTIGWQPPNQHVNLNNQNMGWTTSAPNFQSVNTPRPVVPLFHGQNNNGMNHVPQQQYPHYSTPSQSYWSQGYHTSPSYTPIINNYHTSNYGYVPPPVTIINNNVNNHMHYPQYSYSTNDYGNDHLGFYLGYQLGKMSRPSYHYYSSTYYNGHEYVPLHDHYEIHHYYHNKENVNKDAKVEATQVIACPGDSYAFCPPNTTALCLNGGSVMCVVKNDATTPCPTDSTLTCLTSSIPCVENSGNVCEESNSKYVPASIPCMSTITVNGSLVNNNNFIIVTNSTQDLNSLCVTVAALPAESKTNKKKFQEFRSRKTYHYKTLDMGTSSFGFLVGETLEALLDPGYKYLNYLENGSYIEKFDHYYVYNFYVNKDLIPTSIDIFPNRTSACLGDSATICPNKTISLCTSDGNVLCLVHSKDAKSCNVTNYGCVEQIITCNGSKIPDCRNNTNVKVTIPCFASVKLHGNVSSVNTTFVLNNVAKKFSTLQLLPNVTDVHSYLLAVLAVPAEKTPENRINKEVKKVHKSNELYYNLPTYNYHKESFRSNSIGYFLADKLGKLNFPSYYYLNIEIANKLGEIQKYDHYDIQYNSPNSTYLPKELNIWPNEILPCAGDSGTICPPNTTALCLANGMIMCVTDALLTVPCDNVTKQGQHCVKLKAHCQKLNSKCLSRSMYWHACLPCMSFATVHGNVIYVENTITLSKTYKTKNNYTDLEVVDSEDSNKKQIFCVTVVAVPAERTLSEGERWFGNFRSILSKFMTSAVAF